MSVAYPLGISPAVGAALESIHTVVSVSSGLTHPSQERGDGGLRESDVSIFSVF